MVNKKAQDLSIGTLILIVLGVIVLVLLILGFSLGWGNLWEKINIFQGGSSLNDVVTACNLAVTSQNKFAYCQDFKKVKVDGKTEYVNCEDNRITPSLDSQLNCGIAPGKDAQTPDGFASWYCQQLKDRQGSNYDSSIKVNTKACS